LARYVTTVQPLDPAGVAVLVRVHRPEDAAAGPRPPYFAVCALTRDPGEPAVAHTHGLLARGALSPEAVRDVQAAIFRQAAALGFRRYGYEKVYTDGRVSVRARDIPAQFLRPDPDEVT